MLEAIILGAVAQSSLLASGLAVYWIKVPPKIIGWLAGFGAGALIAAIAFDLVPEDQAAAISQLEGALWLLIGALIFILGERYVVTHFEGEGSSGALGIILGAIVDGIPESIIFGIQVATGLPISVAFLFAVFVSNVPQSLAPSADLAKSGWKIRKMATVWGSVVIACGVAAGLGFWLATLSSDANGARMAALASGGLLAMLTNALIPFAYERGGAYTGLGTVIGFAISLAL